MEGTAMKKIMAIILATALLGAGIPNRSMAGEHGWATAGKIMTGIIGLNILGNVIANSSNAAGATGYATGGVATGTTNATTDRITGIIVGGGQEHHDNNFGETNPIRGWDVLLEGPVGVRTKTKSLSGTES